MEELRAEHPDIRTLRLPSLNDDPELLRMAARWIEPLIDSAAA
jgi:hypothetical protein